MPLFNGSKLTREECAEIVRYADDGKVHKVMHEFKHGELHSGSKEGPQVTNRKQAVAIALSEARKEGEDVPAKNAAEEEETPAEEAAEKPTPLFTGTPKQYSLAECADLIRYQFTEHQHPRAKDGTFMERGSGRDRSNPTKAFGNLPAAPAYPGHKPKEEPAVDHDFSGIDPEAAKQLAEGGKGGPGAKLMDAPSKPTQLAPKEASPEVPTGKPPQADFEARRAKLQERAKKHEDEFANMTDDERKAHKAERDAKAAVHNARKQGQSHGVIHQLMQAWAGLMQPAQQARKAAQKRAASGGKPSPQPAAPAAPQGTPATANGNPFAGFHEQVMADRLEDVKAGRHLRHQAEESPVRYAPLFTGSRLTLEECRAYLERH